MVTKVPRGEERSRRCGLRRLRERPSGLAKWSPRHLAALVSHGLDRTGWNRKLRE